MLSFYVSALQYLILSKGRDRILKMGLTNEQVPKNLIEIYKHVLKS